MTEELVERHAEAKGWPAALARDYFTKYIQYEVTERARLGLARFYDLAGKLGVLEIRRTVKYLEVT
jgi:predicted solute-binding protein